IERGGYQVCARAGRTRRTMDTARRALLGRAGRSMRMRGNGFMGRMAHALVIASLATAYWALRMLGPPTPLPSVGRMNGDLFDIYSPTFVQAFQGRTFLPGWNPYQLAGTPFLAIYNGGFLSPPNWIATIVPVQRALGYLVA